MKHYFEEKEPSEVGNFVYSPTQCNVQILNRILSYNQKNYPISMLCQLGFYQLMSNAAFGATKLQNNV